MLMKFSIFHGCIHRRACDVVTPVSSRNSFNLCEEYANAFRTESYNDFWAHVLDLTLAHGEAFRSRERSAAARLPSYRLFTENLLDPDQPTVTKILAHLQTQCHGPDNHVLLLTDYYSETANASLLCGLLLKDIEQIRFQYQPLKNTLKSLVSQSPSSQGLQSIECYLAHLSKTLNPFASLALSQDQLREVQHGSASLLKRLELRRKKARAKLRFMHRLKRALGLILVAITASVSVIGIYIALHALVALLALPTCLPASSQLPSARWLARVLAQLDAATKGAYILNRDLDTISRLVPPLRVELEHMLALLWFCLDRSGDRRWLSQEMVHQLLKNDASFNQQLDELEEHLFLCFMTINKARSLVMKEILVPGRESRSMYYDSV